MLIEILLTLMKHDYFDMYTARHFVGSDNIFCFIQ